MVPDCGIARNIQASSEAGCGSINDSDEPNDEPHCPRAIEGRSERYNYDDPYHPHPEPASSGMRYATDPNNPNNLIPIRTPGEKWTHVCGSYFLAVFLVAGLACPIGGGGPAIIGCILFGLSLIPFGWIMMRLERLTGVELADNYFVQVLVWLLMMGTPIYILSLFPKVPEP